MGDKYCLITLGPTGSGKSGLKDIVSNYLSRKAGHYGLTGHLLSEDSVQILIDDIIEGHPHYKHLVNQILQANNPTPPAVTPKRLNANRLRRTRHQIAEAPNEDERNAFESAYWETRKLIDCTNKSHQQPVPCNYKDPAKRWLGADKKSCAVISCDGENDNKLERAIRENRNITFETTGTGNVSWLPEMIDRIHTEENSLAEDGGREYQKANYKYVFVYSYVEICTLIVRVLGRAQKKIINFTMADEKAPRLPDIKEMLQNIIKISNFFNKDDGMVNSIKNIGKNNDCYLIIVDNTIELTPEKFAGIITGQTHTSSLIRFCGHFNKDKGKFTILDNKNKLSYYPRVPQNWYNALLDIMKGPIVSKYSPNISEECNVAAREKIKQFIQPGARIGGKKTHTLSKRKSVSRKPSKKRKGVNVGKGTKKGVAAKGKGTKKGKGKGKGKGKSKKK